MQDLILRFIVGGIVVSLFAVLGDLFRPKSFAGLFGAAPSVALATLALTISKHGGAYAAIEGRSMLAGAAALFVYSQLSAWAMLRRHWPALPVTCGAMAVWLSVAFGIWALTLRG